MAALALAETTPRPLIVVLAFVGFWSGLAEKARASGNKNDVAKPIKH